MTKRSGESTACPADTRAHNALAILVVVVASLLAYHNSFSGALVLDDYSAIGENVSIRRLGSLGSVLMPPDAAGVGGRPFANLTFALNHAVSGPAVWSYHASNLVLHALAALTLFGLVRRMLRMPALHTRFGAAAHPLALAIAVLWAVHPLATSAVDYLSQRTEVLMALFYLLTLYAFVRSVERRPGDADGAPGAHETIWQVLAVGACALGMASKETMVTAPAMVFLFDRTFVAGSFRAAWRARWPFHLALAATWLLLAGLMTGSAVAQRGVGYGLGVPAFDYALSECRAVGTYLRLTLWPHPLVFDYGWSFLSGAVRAAPYAVALLVPVAATLVALRRWPAAGFAGAWFFGILAPTSSVVPIIQQPIAESRAYLPLAGLVALGTLGLHRLSGRGNRVGHAATALALGFAGLTVLRNEDYRSEEKLWTDTLAKRPDNARAHSNLGNALAHAGREPEALAHYEEALRLRPDFADAHNNLGEALLHAGRTPEAIAHFEAALRLRPDYADTHYNLGEALLLSGRMPEAIASYEEALQLRPRFRDAHNNLGVALSKTGRNAEAVGHLEEALRIDPDFAGAHYNLGNVLMQSDRRSEAVEHFEEAIRCDPRLVGAHHNLGLLLLQAGHLSEAQEHFEAALRLDPGHVNARRNLERVRALLKP